MERSAGKVPVHKQTESGLHRKFVLCHKRKRRTCRQPQPQAISTVSDHFLLTLNNIADRRECSSPLDHIAEAPEEHQIPDASLVGLAFNIPAEDLSVREENILTYMAGKSKAKYVKTAQRH